jgi:hypothetical protein
MSSGVHFAPIAGEEYGCTIAGVGSRERLWSVALVALVLGAGATSADARRSGTAKTAKFKAELSGTQFSRTDIVDPDNPNCEFPSGTSTERVEFQASTFPLEVTELPPSEIVLTVGKSSGSVRFPVGGTVTRSNMGAATCQDDRRKPEDCGVLPIHSWHPLLQWRTRGFQLVAGGPPDFDPFLNCHGGPFPGLIGAADDEPQVVARASLKQILDRPTRTIVAQGHGFETGRTDTIQTSVALDWRITLTRQRTKKPHRGR